MSLKELLKKPEQQTSLSAYKAHSFCDGDIKYTDREREMYSYFGQIEQWNEDRKKEKERLITKICDKGGNEMREFLGQFEIDQLAQMAGETPAKR